MSISILNGIVLTMDKEEKIIRDGAICIEGERIIDVGKTDDIARKYKAEEKIDAHKKIVMPGLIDAHNHTVTSLRRGPWTMDMELLEYLTKMKWPIERMITEEDTFNGALLGYVDSIKSGTTCLIDNYYPPKDRKRNIDSVAEAAEKAGIRVVLARGYHDTTEVRKIHDAFVEDVDDILMEYERIIQTWHGKADGRIMAWVSPVNLLYCTPESIAKVHELAEKHDVGIHTHAAEAPGECKLIKERYGKGYIELFHDIGVLGPRFHCAHSVWVSDKDIDIMARTKTVAIHNPASNMQFANGTAPVLKMLKAGVNVALGTDSRYGMVESMKFAYNVHRVFPSLNARAISMREVLRMATINGARALGMEKEIGSIEIGKKADITIIDLWKSHIIPIHDPIYALSYCTDNDVDTVIVDGKVLMEGRIVKTVDETGVLTKGQETAESLIQKAQKS